MIKKSLSVAFLAMSAFIASASPRYLVSFHTPDAVVIIDEEGSILWKASEEIDHPQECSLMQDGNILCSERSGVVALGLDQSVKWRFKNPQGTENSVASVLGPDRFLIAVEGPTQLREINSAGDILKEVQLHTTAKKVHAQLRGVVKTPDSTYLASFYKEGAYREYDENGAIVRDFGAIFRAVGALRLENGNTLICNGQKVQELDADDQVVWEFNAATVPGIGKAKPTGLQVLDNGNIMMKFYIDSTTVPAMMEVTREKTVVRKIFVPGYARLGVFKLLPESFKLD